MTLIKRIYLSIVRRKWMSLSVFLVVFIMGVAIFVSTGIYQSTKDARQLVLEKIPLVTAITTNPKSSQNREALTYEIAKEWSEYEGVKYLNYVEDDELLIDFKLFEEDGIRQFKGMYRVPVRRISYHGIMEIEQGQMELVFGSTFTEEDPNGVLISEEIARLNNLSVGQRVGVTVFDEVPGEAEAIEGGFILNIVGIYRYTDISDNVSRNNIVYLMNESIEDFEYESLRPWLKVDDGTIQGYYDTFAYYVLDNPNDIEGFHKFLNKNLPNEFVMSATTNLYNDMIGPLDFIQSMSVIVLTITIISGLLVLVGMLFFYTYSRRKELGMYLSMGESRTRLISMLLLEVTLITLTGLTLALFTGIGVSKMISPPIETPQVENLPENEILENIYQIKLSPELVIAYYVISTGITGISMIVSSVIITRIKPQALLM